MEVIPLGQVHSEKEFRCVQMGEGRGITPVRECKEGYRCEQEADSGLASPLIPEVRFTNSSTQGCPGN